MFYAIFVPTRHSLLFSGNVCYILDRYVPTFGRREYNCIVWPIRNQFSTCPGWTGSENYTPWRWADSD